jgi:uncharacterized membrane protein
MENAITPIRTLSIGKELIIILLIAIPLIYFGYMYGNLPEYLPNNMALDGEPMRMGRKVEILQLFAFMFFTTLMLYVLFRYIPRPTENIATYQEASHDIHSYYNIRIGLHVYLAIYACLVLFLLQMGEELIMEKFVFIGVGILLIAIGIFLKKVPPNNYVGVRTPYTMRDPGIWKETHRVASILWIVVGSVIIVGGLFLTITSGILLFILAAAGIAIIPYIYSYRLFYKTQG